MRARHLLRTSDTNNQCESRYMCFRITWQLRKERWTLRSNGLSFAYLIYTGNHEMAVLGYARVSTADQELDGQVAALKAAGAATVFKEKVWGVRADLPQLAKLMKALKAGDLVIVTQFDRPAVPSSNFGNDRARRKRFFDSPTHCRWSRCFVQESRGGERSRTKWASFSFRYDHEKF